MKIEAIDECRTQAHRHPDRGAGLSRVHRDQFHEGILASAGPQGEDIAFCIELEASYLVLPFPVEEGEALEARTRKAPGGDFPLFPGRRVIERDHDIRRFVENRLLELRRRAR